MHIHIYEPFTDPGFNPVHTCMCMYIYIHAYIGIYVNP